MTSATRKAIARAKAHIANVSAQLEQDELSRYDCAAAATWAELASCVLQQLSRDLAGERQEVLR